MIKRPMTRVNLDKAIGRLAHNDPRKTIDIRTSMANAIVGQFIPKGVVKAGIALGDCPLEFFVRALLMSKP